MTSAGDNSRTAVPAGTRLAGLLVALALGSFVLRGFALVDGSLPYPQNWDESPILAGAARVVQTGDLNPRVYAYPSLPVYIAAASLAAGYVAVNGESGRRIPIAALGRLESPFYEQPQAVAVVRKTWVLLLGGALLALALAARRLGGPWAMALCAWLSLTGTTSVYLAWGYVNVDVPLVLFAALSVLHLVGTAASSRVRDRVVLPAALCGAAIACKYTGVVLLVPSLVALWAWSDRDRVLRSVGLLLGTGASFLAFCPYFVLDLPHFLQGVAYENHHYKVAGHSGNEGVPGLGQLVRYLGFIANEYGAAVLAFAIAGAVAVWRRARVQALMLLALFGAWLGFLSGYKVFFVRNALPVSALVPLFAALGVCSVFSLLAARLSRAGARGLSARPRLAAGLMCGAALALTVPYGRLAAIYARAPDSRARFASWAADHVERGARVLIPISLPIAHFTLPRWLKVEAVDLNGPDAARIRRRAKARKRQYILVPRFSDRGDWVKPRVDTERAGLALLPDPRRVVATFEGTPLIPVRPGDVCVDPAFDVVRIGE